MAIVFDGRKFATQKEEKLAIRILGLKARGVYPKLASILVGNNPASQLYVNLKKKAAEKIGAEVDIYLIKENSKLDELFLLIKTLNTDKTVHGIMIQMPLPGAFAGFKSQIINSINPEKDVDGLRADSPFLHPTSKAVIQILDEAKNDKNVRLALKEAPCKVIIVGATGMVGTPLVKELKEEGYEVVPCDSDTPDLKGTTLQGDVVISCTGVPNLIKNDMVKDGAIVIDVGSPKGDIEFESVGSKASFITPVPGGVGPVTIGCLLENLISAC
jgi:methylenetetrahydrofolate dehydrogenase (NADP+)/methenyltetrahydrofolate cyclohydrolase